VRRSRRRALGVAAFAAVIVAAALAWSDRRGSSTDLGAALERVVDSGAPGALVVVREGNDVESATRGTAGAGTPMVEDLRFRVGSVTKTFVAVLVLSLVEDGLLRLDDPVERWLPGVVPGGDAITVRRLLDHTSGLPDYVESSRIEGDRNRRWQPTELVELALAGGGTPHADGRFAYASTNYVLLGLIAEAATGQPLDRLLSTRLFEPLGLSQTSFEPGVVRGTHVHGHRAPSHQGVVTGQPVDIGDEPAWWTWAAGGVVSTAEDVQRFFAALLRGELLSTRSMREMETLVPAGRQRYGLGLAVFPTPCGPAWGHTGNVQGTVAVAWNARDATRQVVLIVNSYPLSAELEEAVRDLQLAAFCGG
jgi:D-alanyl-D-alanine carboxypeptidase